MDTQLREGARVLLTCPDLDRPGGVAQYYSVLREHLSPMVEYFTVGSRKEPSATFQYIKRVFKDHRTFSERLRCGNYDIVHLNPSLGPKSIIRDGLLLLTAKKYGKKTVIFMHGWDHSWEKIIRRFFLKLFRFVYFRADSFIVLAAEFREKLWEMGYRNPVYVETTVVTDDTFLLTKDRNTRIRKTSKDAWVNILCLTRVEREKGIYEAIEAYNILKSSYPNITLIIAGDGKELNRARKYVRGKNIKNIVFLGHVTGELKQRTFLESDIYLFPSYYGEGMPTSVLEAMSYGLPVVTSPVGGVKDFFEDGRMGFITESRDPKVIAERLERLLRDPELRSRMDTFNREYAEKNFTASKVAVRIKEIYRNVLAS